MEKLIITAAITGAELTKKENPNLPCSPEEQATAAWECHKAGASLIHLHVRDGQQKPSQEVERFQHVANLIQERCDVIVQFSTGGAVGESIENRKAPLVLCPEMASLNMGSINFGNEVFINLPQDIEALMEEMKQRNSKPEIEVYDIGMLEYGISLVATGKIPQPAHFQFVMGTKYGVRATEENLKFMASKLPPGSTFTVAGIGKYQLEMAKPAIQMGGHVRCGMEDNIYYTKGVLAQSNAQLVEQIGDLARNMGRKIASTTEARNILTLVQK